MLFKNGNYNPIFDDLLANSYILEALQRGYDPGILSEELNDFVHNGNLYDFNKDMAGYLNGKNLKLTGPRPYNPNFKDTTRYLDFPSDILGYPSVNDAYNIDTGEVYLPDIEDMSQNGSAFDSARAMENDLLQAISNSNLTDDELMEMLRKGYSDWDIKQIAQNGYAPIQFDI